MVCSILQQKKLELDRHKNSILDNAISESQISWKFLKVFMFMTWLPGNETNMFFFFAVFFGRISNTNSWPWKTTTKYVVSEGRMHPFPRSCTDIPCLQAKCNQKHPGHCRCRISRSNFISGLWNTYRIGVPRTPILVTVFVEKNPDSINWPRVLCSQSIDGDTICQHIPVSQPQWSENWCK